MNVGRIATKRAKQQKLRKTGPITAVAIQSSHSDPDSETQIKVQNNIYITKSKFLLRFKKPMWARHKE